MTLPYPLVTDNIFTLIASFYRNIVDILIKDAPVFGNFSFLKIVLGMIVLSGCITVFWKGARG